MEDDDKNTDNTGATGGQYIVVNVIMQWFVFASTLCHILRPVLDSYHWHLPTLLGRQTYRSLAVLLLNVKVSFRAVAEWTRSH